MKAWYLSKTLWVNFVAICVFVIQDLMGIHVSPELQGAALGVINMGLRAITKQAVQWNLPAITDKPSDLGFVRLRLLSVMAVIIALALALLAACATVSGKTDTPQITVGKTLLAIQHQIVTVRDAVAVPCQRGFIAQQDCKAIDGFYQQSKPTYDAAVDLAVIALTSGQEADAQAYAKQQAALQSLLLNMTTITTKYGIAGGAK